MKVVCLNVAILWTIMLLPGDATASCVCENCTVELGASCSLSQGLDAAANCQAAGCTAVTVVVPPGEHHVSITGRTPSGTTLRGSGHGVSVLYRSTLSQPILVNRSALITSNLRIEGVTFEDRGQGTDPLVDLGMREGFSISACALSDSGGIGLRLLDTRRGIIRSCSARGNALAGFVVDSVLESNTSSQDVTLTGCSAKNNSGHGFEIGSSDRIMLSGSLAGENGGDGFSLRDSTTVTITGCVANANTADGFDLSGCHDLSLTSSHAKHNGGNGVVHGKSPASPASRFSFTGGTSVCNGVDGVRIKAASSGTISGLTVMNNGRDGIRLAKYAGGDPSRPHDILVSGCKISDDQEEYGLGPCDGEQFPQQTQQYAINSVHLLSTAIHAMNNDVSGNVQADPIVLNGCPPEDCHVAHNFGDVP